MTPSASLVKQSDTACPDTRPMGTAEKNGREILTFFEVDRMELFSPTGLSPVLYINRTWTYFPSVVIFSLCLFVCRMLKPTQYLLVMCIWPLPRLTELRTLISRSNTTNCYKLFKCAYNSGHCWQRLNQLGSPGWNPMCDGDYASLIRSYESGTRIWCSPSARLTEWPKACAWKVEPEGQSVKHGNINLRTHDEDKKDNRWEGKWAGGRMYGSSKGTYLQSA